MILRLMKWWWRVRRPKWREIGDTDPLSSTSHGKHSICFVSRHEIAEAGLKCPSCGNEAAARGVFKRVEECRLGEVIVCDAMREVNDDLIRCNALLVASPDTEHGDHLLWDKTPADQRHKLFHHFKRRSPADVARDQYGDDIVLDAEGAVLADAVKTTLAPTTPPEPKLTYTVDEVYHTSDGRLARVLRVNNNGDPYYDGWAYVSFDEEDQAGWLVDRHGVINLERRDPTKSGNIRLLSLSQPI